MVTPAQVDATIDAGLSYQRESWQKDGTFYTVDMQEWTDIKYELNQPVKTPIGIFERVAEHGGMDQGSEYWVVISVTQDDGTVQYFRRDGYYASHDGGYLDGATIEVTPIEKTITVYGTL